MTPLDVCLPSWIPTRENRLVLAQVAIEEKSNEITAIPLLRQQLALSGCIVTIDAMGTQTKIAQQIIEQEGDYALARKRQPRHTRGMPWHQCDSSQASKKPSVAAIFNWITMLPVLVLSASMAEGVSST